MPLVRRIAAGALLAGTLASPRTTAAQLPTFFGNVLTYTGSRCGSDWFGHTSGAVPPDMCGEARALVGRNASNTGWQLYLEFSARLTPEFLAKPRTAGPVVNPMSYVVYRVGSAGLSNNFLYLGACAELAFAPGGCTRTYGLGELPAAPIPTDVDFSFQYTPLLDTPRTADLEFRLAQVPEPGTWALLGTGLLAVGAVARRRRTA